MIFRLTDLLNDAAMPRDAELIQDFEKMAVSQTILAVLTKMRLIFSEHIYHNHALRRYDVDSTGYLSPHDPFLSLTPLARIDHDLCCGESCVYTPNHL